jgi:hypothetical protein
MPPLWAWYLDPWTEPDVISDLSSAITKGRPIEAEMRLELAELHTINGDCGGALHYLPAAIPEVREDYTNKGFKLIQRVVGSMSRGDLTIWPPSQVECEFVIQELLKRQRWSLAQIDAWIDETKEHVDASTGGGRDEISFWRRRLRQLNTRRRVMANGLPTSRELRLWFVGIERLRVQARFDRKFMEQLNLQQKDQFFAQLQQRLTSAVLQEGERNADASEDGQV